MNQTTRCAALLACIVFMGWGGGAEAALPYWIFFTDRGTVDVAKAVAAKAASSSEPKSRCRRARMQGTDAIFGVDDVPVNADYIAEVVRVTGNVRTVSRWFNAVTADIEDGDRATIERLPFVREIRPVAAFKRPAVTPAGVGKIAVPEKAEAYSYGDSYEQMNMIGVTDLHTLGYNGDGITIAVLDSGFDGIGHTAFDSLTVAGKRDFVGRDNDPSGDDHGTEVLSIMAALDRGRMIGSAPHASYLLARTEIVASSIDLRIEEDYFVAGIEWADSLGADIVNASIGYTTFSGGTGYTYEDLDGDTAITTIASDAAAAKGILVLTSAGNEANDPWYYVTTPADGDSVFAVGSVDRDGNVSRFSSRGPTYDGRIKPDFVALGENVLVVNAAGTNAYKYVNGTSFASPALSGALALLLQIHPTWDYGAVKKALVGSAASAGADTLGGYGIPNIFKASGLEPPETPVSSFRIHDPFPQPITFSATNRRIFFPVDIPAAGRKLTIKIFTFSGEIVQTIETRFDESGEFRNPGEAPSWDGTNYLGEDVAPGVYYFSAQLFGYGNHTGKVMVMR